MKNVLLLFLGIVAIFLRYGPAQVSTAELNGSVVDATGAAVANAKVVAANAATGLTREAVSDVAGAYIMTLLPPGSYNMTVEAEGFRRIVQSNITLQVNQRAKLDFTLQVGQVNESIEVAAAAPLLESQSSSLGSVIAEQFVGELPLNGRNFVQLAILSPGVNGTGFSTSGTIMSGTRPDDRRPGTEIFSNGNREGSNNFLFDGVDNNDRLTLSIVLRPGVEAIKEFKVQTNLYSADLGRNSGAVVDVVTKSGTNQFHGSAFEFLRNSAMDARNFFNPRGTPFPTFRYNQFGGSFGGPVIIPRAYNGKNRTFFFVDYEGFRRSELRTLNTSVATPNMRAGDFTGENGIFDPLTTRSNGAGGFIRDPFPNNRIPAARFDPVSRKLVNAYPLPQFARSVNNYTSNLNQKQDWNQGDVRVDHQFTQQDTFFARWSIQHTETIVPDTFPAVQIEGLPGPVTVGNEDSFAGPSFTPVQHAVASHVHVFSPRLINELRVGFNRFVLDYTALGYEPGLNLGNKLGIPNSNVSPNEAVLPIINLSNYTGVGHSRSLPIFRRMNTFQYVDNMTFTRGAHTLKFGGDIRRRQITEYQTNRGNGRFNFGPAFTNQPGVNNTGHVIATFLLGYPTFVEQDYTLAWIGARGIETGLYFADDWRATRKLTLNLGMRWEYYSPYSEVANRWANFDAATATVLIAGRDGVDSRAGIQRDFRNFAPRFGFAYHAMSRTVLRGGYGIFFNPNGNGGALLRLQRHIPFGPINTVFQGGNIDVGPKISDGFPAPPVVNFDAAKNPTGGVVGVSPDYRSAYAQQYNLTLEHELPGSTLIKAAFVGNLGRRLGTTFDLNQPVPGPGGLAQRRPFFGVRPDLFGITYAVSDGLSSYHAFQLTVEKRMSHGLGLLLGYTWGHSIDNVGTEFGGGTGTPQDSRNRAAERGNASFDMRHRLTASYTYRLPFGRGRAMMNRGGAANFLLGGWQTNGITTIQSGLPFTPGLQVPTTNCCGSRPDGIRDATLPAGERSLQRWFDVTAFGTPPLHTFGNLGRNTLFGPGRVNFDFSLFKDFAFHEEMKLQFRAEAFNLFNTPQFGLPNASIGAAQAGIINSTVGNPRQLQLALRLQF
ncbi:MAG: carboxypeptidase regulatory-like domain-containing protein [Bryobacteraceae bacterium]